MFPNASCAELNRNISEELQIIHGDCNDVMERKRIEDCSQKEPVDDT